MGAVWDRTVFARNMSAARKPGGAVFRVEGAIARVRSLSRWPKLSEYNWPGLVTSRGQDFYARIDTGHGTPDTRPETRDTHNAQLTTGHSNLADRWPDRYGAASDIQPVNTRSPIHASPRTRSQSLAPSAPATLTFCQSSRHRLSAPASQIPGYTPEHSVLERRTVLRHDTTHL